MFVNKYFIRNNTPNEYHTCHIQLSLNVHRIRYRPTWSIRVWLSGLRLYLQSDRDKTLHWVVAMLMYRIFRTISRSFFLPRWQVDLYSGATYVPTNSLACLLTSVGKPLATDCIPVCCVDGTEPCVMPAQRRYQMTVYGWGIWPVQPCWVHTNSLCNLEVYRL